MEIFFIIITILFFSLFVYILTNLILICINAKYYIHKKYNTQKRWLFLQLFCFAVILGIVTGLFVANMYEEFKLYFMLLDCFGLFNIVLYLVIPHILEGYIIEINNFNRINFKLLIEKYKIKISRDDIKNILLKKINKFHTIADKYELYHNEIVNSKPDQFISKYQLIINFNNNVTLFNFKLNKLIYKLVLYLCYDLQTVITTKK